MRKKQRRRESSPLDRHFASLATSFAIDAFTAIDSPLSRSMASSLRSEDYIGSLSVSVDPANYTDSSSFRDDYLCAELMSKFPSWELGIDRSQVAFEKFRESEVACAETNHRLSSRYVNGVLSELTPESAIWLAREKIARLLGPFNWDHAARYFGFGKGATFDLPRRRSDAYYKYGQKPSVTSACAVLAYTCILQVPRWFQHVVSLTGLDPIDFLAKPVSERVQACFDIVDGNRVTTVPKDAKKDRVIAIEPTMNGYIQHGLGGVIRSRLRRVGVDLNDQTRNQSLARLGSIDGSLSTMDLSSASDTVAMRLVEELLPPDWVVAMKLCRSPVGFLPDGTVLSYHKVSSMGNGFTFELESLIFWALGSSVCSLLKLDSRHLSVYGDDIIIPTDGATMLSFVLKHCGFSVNAKKTWVSGPFRESCGKHYYRGDDVTPLYIRKDVRTPSDLIWLCNQLRRWSRLYWGLDGRMHPVYSKYCGYLPTSLRHPSIPDGLGDFALFGDLDECRPSFSRLTWSYRVKFWFPVMRTRVFCDSPYLLRKLDGRPDFFIREETELPSSRKRWDKVMGVLAVGSGVPIRSQTVRWKLSNWLPVNSWECYGPWLLSGT